MSLLTRSRLAGVSRPLRAPVAGVRRGWRAFTAQLAGPAARVQRLTKPMLAPITPLGYWAVIVALGAAVAALLLGWIELAGVAIVLLLSVLAAIGFVLGRPSYRVSVDLASLRVVVGERATGGISVQSASARSTAPSQIELPVGRAVAAFTVPRLDPGELHEESFTIPTQRRAVLPLGPVRSVRRDPLDLLRREVTWTEPEEIFVHPRTVRLDNSSTGFVRDLEGLATRDLSNDDVSFHALREYVPGDDLRYVHWRSTARTNRLMIRQFEETRRSQFVIVVSTRPDEYAGDDEFELGIAVAASLSRSAQVDGKEVTVYTTDARLAGPTPASLLDGYSRVEPSPAGPNLVERVRVVAADSPAASVVALITGSRTPLEQLRLASVRVPTMARSFAIRAAAAEELSRKSVGDFQMLTVPVLEELPRAMRAVSA